MEQMRRRFREGALLLRALVKPAARSVRENVGLAALSVVLAFALWIFVTDTENPTRTGGLPLGLTAADFEATVDLDGLSAGAYDLPVEVKGPTARGGLRITDVLPGQIEVRL